MKLKNSRYDITVLRSLNISTPRPTREGMGVGLLFLFLFLLSSCAISDDLPLPYCNVEIIAFEIEGQCDSLGRETDAYVVNPKNSTIDLWVNDAVDISRLRVKKMKVNYEASIAVENAGTYFPSKSFFVSGQSCYAMKDSTYIGKDCSTLDFSRELTFVLTATQECRWKVRVHQVINREIEVENQVGTPTIDVYNHNVIVYVAPTQDLKTVKVKKMLLGGAHGKVSPDPTGEILDFSWRRTFQVTYAWSKTSESWDVFIYNAEKGLATTAQVFPHASRAYVSGSMQNGTTPKVKYRQLGSSEWQTVPSDYMQINTVSYEAVITNLLPDVSYEYQVTAGNSSSAVSTFHTALNMQLENSSFDDWHIVGTGTQALYNPWREGGTSYWDTGNRGATTVGASNSTFATEGGRTYANLQSKYIVIKFAAGNIFTGTYLKTDGTNGVLSMGRPFNSFPTKMQFDYTYKSSIVNKGGGKWDEKYSRYISQKTYDEMRGKPDSCCIYIALIGDKDEEMYEGVIYPYIIRTRPSELHLFDPNNENVIAYGQFTSGDDQTDWKTKTITLDYRYKNRTPKYVIVVISSSKYGDYFIGGDASLLKIDNLKLIYD